MLNPLHLSGPRNNLNQNAIQRQQFAQSHSIFALENLTADRAGHVRQMMPVSRVPSTSQVLGTSALSGQNTAAATQSQNAQPAILAAVTKTAPASTSAPATPQLTGDAAVLQSLKNALAAAGINYDGLGLAVHQDVVSYPGGTYVNRYISVDAHGHEEGLMTDLVGMNPNVAVLDIKHMLGQG